MYLATNVAAAAMLALSILFYVFVYTMWLKRRTPQNIVIGGAAGAFPPVIGWAAVTGSVDVLPLLLFAIVFFWTPPHFWALSLYASRRLRARRRADAAGRGRRRARPGGRCCSTPSCWSRCRCCPGRWAMPGRSMAVSAVVLGAGVPASPPCGCCWDRQDADGRSLTKDAPARLAFRYSLLYLFAAVPRARRRSRGRGDAA